MARESNLQIRVEVNCEEYCSVEAIDMNNISLGEHTGKDGTEAHSQFSISKYRDNFIDKIAQS
jgi:hypothetical protein